MKKAQEILRTTVPAKMWKHISGNLELIILKAMLKYAEGKTELSNQEKLLKAQDELIFLLDKQSLTAKFTSEECDAWAKLKLEVSRLKKEVEFETQKLKNI